jgi:predicted Zn-dependent protease
VRWAYVAVALAVVSAAGPLIGGCGGVTNVALPPGGTYTNPNYGYSVDYPSGFALDSADPAAVSLINGAGNGFRVDIHVHENSFRRSLGEWIQANERIDLNTYPRLSDGTAIMEKAIINGLAAIRLRLFSEGQTIVTYINDEAHGRIFTLSAAGMSAVQTENFERDPSTALKIIDSFRIP